jgi:hypothetical protein
MILIETPKTEEDPDSEDIGQELNSDLIIIYLPIKVFLCRPILIT